MDLTSDDAKSAARALRRSLAASGIETDLDARVLRPDGAPLPDEAALLDPGRADQLGRVGGGGRSHVGDKVEQLLAEASLIKPGESLYDIGNISLMHHLNAALRAAHLYHRDQQYVVQNGEIIIVDEFTGRLMPGRRWSDGLHQAVEAKEKVKIERENQTLATVTFQNYFRKYKKLSGMTGTAVTEAEEFNKIYKLDVIAIPTNRPLARIEEPDAVYKTEREKYDAIVTQYHLDQPLRHERGLSDGPGRSPLVEGDDDLLQVA